MKYKLTSSSLFDKWFLKLKDRSVKNRVLARLSRLENGSFGDHKMVANRLYELRFTFGGGIRIYYAVHNYDVVLLLCGGNKSSQSKDILKAKELLLKFWESEDGNEIF